MHFISPQWRCLGKPKKLSETYFVNWFPCWMGVKYQKIKKTNTYPALYHTWSIYLGYFEIRRWIFG